MSEEPKPRLLLGLTPLAEREVEQQLFRAGQVAVAGSAANASELLALAERQRADAVLVGAELPGLDAACCARLRAAGLRLLGLALDDRNAATLTAFGIDTPLRPPFDPDELAAACTDHARVKAEPSLAVEPDPVTMPPSARRDPGRAGSLLAVVPAAGSPGASECACSLAALADRRWPTLLVELDLVSGGLDLRLGADAQQGSLLGLVRAPASDDGSLRDLLQHWTVGGERGWPAVLLAPPNPEAQIAELARPGAIRTALEAACSLYPLVVVDVGALLAAPGELPQAARCHREALLVADAALVVVGAGEKQLRAGRAQLARLLEVGVKRERLRVAVTGLGAPGAGKKSELEVALNNELAELGLAVDAWLPYDGRAAARAQRSGLPFALARPRGGYARALQTLLDELLLPTQPVARDRKTRLRIPTPTASTPVQERVAVSAIADQEVQLPWRS